MSCIKDNEQYLVKDPKIRNFIFNLAKKKLKKESLVLTPNMIRFLALKLISEHQTLMIKIGNVIFSSSNLIRLLTRVSGTVVIGVLGTVFIIVLYAVFMAIIYFDQTQNCGYNCNAYFEQLPKQVPVKIYVEQPAGHLVITENNHAHQVEIYIPLKLPEEIIYTDTGGKVVRKSYQLSRKKAQEVKFSDF